jgi:osmotically-inducible protein OsmY
MLATEEQSAVRLGTAIEQSPHLAVRRLRVATQQDQIVLEGVVGSYYEKQVAQETIRRIDGVRQIDNRLEVCPHRQRIPAPAD